MSIESVLHPSHPLPPSSPFAFSLSVQFSHSVVSDSLQPHESQHTRPPCPSHKCVCSISVITLWDGSSGSMLCLHGRGISDSLPYQSLASVHLQISFSVQKNHAVVPSDMSDYTTNSKKNFPRVSYIIYLAAGGIRSPRGTKRWLSNH